MAVLYISGECGIKEWFGNAVGADMDDTGRLGERGARVIRLNMVNANGFNCVGYESFGAYSNGPDIWMLFNINFDAEPQDDNALTFDIRPWGGGDFLRRFYIDYTTGNERKFTILGVSGTSEYARTTTQWTANTTYICLWHIHNESGNTYDEFKVYNTSLTLLETLSPGAWTYTAANFGQMKYGMQMSKGGTNPNTRVSLDNIVINDNSGSVFNTAPPLDCCVLQPLPNGDSTQEWKKIDGTTQSSYDQVDEEETDEVTTYNRSMTTDGELDMLCELQGQSIKWDSDYNPPDPNYYSLEADDRIDCVWATIRYCQGVASNASPMRWLWNDNGVEGSGAFSYDAGTGWTGPITKFMSVTPTGGYAWPQSIFDTFRFGLRKMSGATDFWCTIVSLRVLISPGAGDHQVPGAAARRIFMVN